MLGRNGSMKNLILLTKYTSWTLQSKSFCQTEPTNYKVKLQETADRSNIDENTGRIQNVKAYAAYDMLYTLAPFELS